MWLFYLFAPSQSSAPATHLVLGGSEKTKLQYAPRDKSRLLRAGSHLSPTSVSSSQNMGESLRLSAIGHRLTHEPREGAASTYSRKGSGLSLSRLFHLTKDPGSVSAVFLGDT